MEHEVCRAKISHLTVTRTEVDYIEGSLTVDGELLDEAGLYPYERVLVINTNSGDRFETYLIAGEEGERNVCLNGGTARLGLVGDELIVLCFARVSRQEIEDFEPVIYKAGENNELTRKK
jgi:aspartate 1-decarboxylase